ARSVDESKLEIMAEHIQYEVWMLTCTTDLLNNANFTVLDEQGHIARPVSNLEVVLHNAVFESSLIHLRALHEFLGPPPKKHRRDDLFACDFLPSWDAPPILNRTERAY